MKKSHLYIGVLALFLIFGTTSTSCKTKEGCGLEEKMDPARYGKKTKTKSGLLSKKQKRRLKKRG